MFFASSIFVAIATFTSVAEDWPKSENYRSAPWSSQYVKRVKQVANSFGGELAVYVSDPVNGVRTGYREDEPMYLASVVKVAFMLEIFRQRERRILSFDERLPYLEGDIRDGGPKLNKQKVGSSFSIPQLLEWMMHYSDNAASDMLAKRVSLQSINRGLIELGIPNIAPLTYLIDVRRGIYRNLDVAADDLESLDVRKIRWTRIWNPQLKVLSDKLGKSSNSFSKKQLLRAYDDYYRLGVNHAPMASIGLIMEKMARRELVSRAASSDMVNLMLGAKTSRNRLMGKLPRNTPVAHKTGSQFKRICDVGLIYLPDNAPIVVAACTANADVKKAEGAIATVAREAYDLAWKYRRKLARAL